MSRRDVLSRPVFKQWLISAATIGSCWIAFLCSGEIARAHDDAASEKPAIQQASAPVVQLAQASPGDTGGAAPHLHPPGPVVPHEHPETPVAPAHVHPSEESALPTLPASDVEAPHQHGEMESAAHTHAAEEAGHGTPAASLVRFLFLLSLVVAGGLMFSARRSLGAGVAATAPPGRNLLALPLIGKFLRSRAFLALLLVPTLLIFAFIVMAGLLGEQDTSNPAVLLTWILWWPAVIFTFFLVGRIWCAFCPFGYLGDVAQKIFCLNWKVPSILRNMWWRWGLFLGLTWATSLWALDRWPQGTAWLALSLTLGAMALGVLFEKRAFCRYVCPVGGVFGLYSMTAPVRVAAKDRGICQRDCRDKNCYSACKWSLFPATLDRNAECNLCLDCVRACPHDNLAFRTQPIGTDLAEFQPHRKSFDEAATVAAVLGVSLFQTLVMLNSWGNWEATIGSWLHLAPGRLLFTILFLSLGVFLPALLLIVVSPLSLPEKEARGDLFRSLRAYAYCFVPLGLALHGAHNFHHLFGEGGAMWVGLKNAVAQYTGWTELSAGAGSAAAPNPDTLFALQWLALMGGLYLAFRVTVAVLRREGNPPARALRSVLPILLFATAYTLLNLAILSASMAHRH